MPEEITQFSGIDAHTVGVYLLKKPPEYQFPNISGTNDTVPKISSDLRAYVNSVAHSGNPDSFTEIYNVLASKMTNAAEYLGAESGEDIFQDVMLLVYEKDILSRAMKDPSFNFYGYVGRILHNVTMTELRRKKGRIFYPLIDDDIDQSMVYGEEMDQYIEDEQLMHTIFEAKEHLSDDNRQVVDLFLSEEQQGSAKYPKIPEGTLRQRKRRAFLYMKQYIENQDNLTI